MEGEGLDLRSNYKYSGLAANNLIQKRQTDRYFIDLSCFDHSEVLKNKTNHLKEWL
jgi:hypothetical protein